MIEPLRFNHEACPAFPISKPVFCEICLSSRSKMKNPNVASKYCINCLSKRFMCEECDDSTHRLGVYRNHLRRIIVLGHGVRKALITRGDGVSFPLPLDRVKIKIKSRIFHEGKLIHREPVRHLDFIAGLSGKTVHIQVLGARNLLASDLGGTSDPFVKVLYCGTSMGSTRVRPRALNPKWDNESYIVPMSPTLPPTRGMAKSQREMVKLEVYDYDWVGDNDFLGHVEMPRGKLHQLAVTAQGKPLCLPLSIREFHGIVGIKLGICDRYVHLKIERAESIDNPHPFGMPNPYVKVFTAEDKLVGTTSVCQASCDPTWTSGNTFHFKINDFLKYERKLLRRQRRKDGVKPPAPITDPLLAAALGISIGQTAPQTVRLESSTSAADDDVAAFSFELYDRTMLSSHIPLGKARVSVLLLRKMLPSLPNRYLSKPRPAATMQEMMQASQASDLSDPPLNKSISGIKRGALGKSTMFTSFFSKSTGTVLLNGDRDDDDDEESAGKDIDVIGDEEGRHDWLYDGLDEETLDDGESDPLYSSLNQKIEEAAVVEVDEDATFGKKNKFDKKNSSSKNPSSPASPSPSLPSSSVIAMSSKMLEKQRLVEALEAEHGEDMFTRKRTTSDNDDDDDDGVGRGVSGGGDGDVRRSNQEKEKDRGTEGELLRLMDGAATETVSGSVGLGMVDGDSLTGFLSSGGGGGDGGEGGSFVFGADGSYDNVNVLDLSSASAAIDEESGEVHGDRGDGNGNGEAVLRGRERKKKAEREKQCLLAEGRRRRKLRGEEDEEDNEDDDEEGEGEGDEDFENYFEGEEGRERDRGSLLINTDDDDAHWDEFEAENVRERERERERVRAGLLVGEGSVSVADLGEGSYTQLGLGGESAVWNDQSTQLDDLANGEILFDGPEGEGEGEKDMVRERGRKEKGGRVNFDESASLLGHSSPPPSLSRSISSFHPPSLSRSISTFMGRDGGGGVREREAGEENGEGGTVEDSVRWSLIRHFAVEQDSTKNITGGRDKHEDRGCLVVRLLPSARGNVVVGLDEGIRTMSVGETSSIKARFDYAYNNYCMGGNIPPRANIIFTVQLLAVNGKGRFGAPIRQARRFLRLFIRTYKMARRNAIRTHRFLGRQEWLVSCYRSLSRILCCSSTTSDEESVSGDGDHDEGDGEGWEEGEGEEDDEEAQNALAMAMRTEIKADPRMRKLVNQQVKQGSKYMWGWKPEQRVVNIGRPTKEKPGGKSTKQPADFGRSAKGGAGGGGGVGVYGEENDFQGGESSALSGGGGGGELIGEKFD